MRWLVVTALLLGASGHAFAQKAEADAAFRRGRALMAKGETEKACAEFEASMKLDPERGTLYNLGICHEQLGKLASAWSEFRELAESDTNAERRKDSSRRAAALEPRLIRMRLVLRKPAPDATVTRDNLDVTPLVGKTTPVDPGKYTFVAKAPGRESQTLEVALDKEGETIDVDIPELAVEGGTTQKRHHDDEEPAPIDDYPRQLPQRPLVLPRGMAELAVMGVVVDDDNNPSLGVNSALRARYGLGWLEVELDVGAHLKYGEDPGMRPGAFHFIEGAVRYPITPMFTVGVEFTKFQPTSDRGSGSDVRTLVSRKTLIAPAVAVDGRGGVLFSQRDESGHSEISLVGEGRIQIAPLSWLSFEVFAGLDLNASGDLYDNTVAFRTAASGLISITHQLDAFVTGGTSLYPTNPRESTLLFGTAWRTR
jgi:hypothetical protein